MPTSPKIPKSLILEKSLELLIEEGWNNVNIKTIAKKIGCSTQPISWHFKNMDGLRSSLSIFAYEYANKLMEPNEDDPHPFSSIGDVFVDIAFEKPNLYKFLYLDGGSKYSLGGLKEIKEDKGNDEIADFLAKKYDSTKENMMNYILDIIVYTQGILSFKVSGIIDASKEEIKEKIANVSKALLMQYLKR